MDKDVKKLKAIINGRIVLNNKTIENKVLVFDKKILDISDKVPEGAEIIDAKGNIVSPGLIDIHIHGSGGSDTMDGTKEALEIISSTIVKNGVTGYLPTTMTMSKDKIYKALDTIEYLMDKDLIDTASIESSYNDDLKSISMAEVKGKGAKVLGCHMEGPFINEKYKGAQSKEHILKPSYDFIKKYKNIIKIITFAPEMDETHSFIKDVKANTNITLSIGHSNATFEEAMSAIDEGVSHITHTFNAMTPLNHRKPGIVGAAFSSDTTSEFIADKIHIHPGIFQIFLNNKGKKNVVLITDSMRAGCMKDGKSELGGQTVYVKDGSARLEDGTLAGSILTLNKAVYNFFNNTNLKLHEAIALATINPARVIKLDNKKGSLEIGKDADITIFNEAFDALVTMVEGNIVYNNLY